MKAITVEVGSVDVYFDDLVEEVVDLEGEADLLESLAKYLEYHLSAASKEEASFGRNGAAELRKCAAWFRENAP